MSDVRETANCSSRAPLIVQKRLLDVVGSVGKENIAATSCTRQKKGYFKIT